MALGKRKRERQLEAFVAASDLPQSPGHPFYAALNRLLAENDFDSFVEFNYWSSVCIFSRLLGVERSSRGACWLDPRLRK